MSFYDKKYAKNQATNSNNDQFTYYSYLKKACHYKDKSEIIYNQLNQHNNSKHTSFRDKNHKNIIIMHQHLKSLAQDSDIQSKQNYQMKNSQDFVLEEQQKTDFTLNEKLELMTQRLKKISEKNYFSPKKSMKNLNYAGTITDKLSYKKVSAELELNSFSSKDLIKAVKSKNKSNNSSSKNIAPKIKQQPSRIYFKNNDFGDKKKKDKNMITMSIQNNDNQMSIFTQKIPKQYKYIQSKHLSSLSSIFQKNPKDQHRLLKQKSVYQPHRAKISGIHATSKQKNYITCSYDYYVNQIDDDETRKLYKHRGCIQCLLVTSTSMIITGGRDSYIRSIDYSYKMNSCPTQILQTAQKHLLIQTYQDINLFDIQKRKIIEIYETKEQTNIFSNDTNIMIGNKNSLKIYDIRLKNFRSTNTIRSKEQVQKWIIHPKKIDYLIQTENILYNPNSRSRGLHLPKNQQIISLEWTDNGLFYLNQQGSFKYWDMKSFESKIIDEQDDANMFIIDRKNVIYGTNHGEVIIKQFS